MVTAFVLSGGGSGEEVVLSTGDPVDAILASAAIPAVFLSMRIGDRELVDGGVADNAAVALGADGIYVLPTGYACALQNAPASPPASALQVITFLIEQRLILEVAYCAEHSDIRVLPPICRARTVAERRLDEGGPRLTHPERSLSLHHHTSAVNPCHGGRAA